MLLQIFCRSAPLYIWLNNGSLETTSYAVSQLICSVPSFDALYPNSDKSLVSDVQAITWPSIATLLEDFSSIICSKALRLFCLDPRFSYKAFKENGFKLVAVICRQFLRNCRKITDTTCSGKSPEIKQKPS